MILLLLALQAPLTVGDTVWVRNAARLPAQYTARIPDWKPAGEVELIGTPQLTIRGDSAEVAYPLVAWLAGRHRVEVPGPLLVGPGGQLDSGSTRAVTLSVTSVLPAVAPDSSLAPQPPVGVVPRTETTLIPVGLALAAALALLVPLHLWWRRRGPAMAPRAAPTAVALPVERWSEAGEQRVVLAAAAHRLRSEIEFAVGEAVRPGANISALLAAAEARRPRWPHRELGEVLGALDQTRFAPVSGDSALRLHAQAVELADRLRSAS